MQILQAMIRRVATSLLVLLGIAFLALFGLNLAQLGRKGLPTNAIGSITDAVQQLFNYLFHHPQTYVWHKEILPAWKVVFSLFINSAGLLLISLLIAGLVGIAFGILAAQFRGRGFSPVMLLISILGVSTPSFLLAMLFWILNVQVFHLLGRNRAFLPPTGFGWDLHLVMPALVLAARPLAQIMQVTYVSMSEALTQDYMRSARARGAGQRLLVFRHALRNVLIPILTTLGTSLRFSLASLPVVESFFIWTGLGLGLLQAVNLEMDTLVVDMLVALGAMFIIINFILEFLYPLIDPRLRKNDDELKDIDEYNWSEQFGSLQNGLAGALLVVKLFFAPLVRRFHKPVAATATAGAYAGAIPASTNVPTQPSAERDRAEDSPAAVDQSHEAEKKSSTPIPVASAEEVPYASSGKRILQSALTNLPLIIGSLMVFGLLVLVTFGGHIVKANPYETHGVQMVDGVIQSPPFKPTASFPWGSDIVGRDVRSLVFAGARATLTLAFFGMLARLAVGVLLGMFAGWWQRSWLDQVINAVIAIWAAFPVTLFAMILILGMGIQKGMSVFIIALCVIGWGEIAQYVRGQVISQKPQLYIEAARSVGARPMRILFKHVLPHLLPSMLVMSALEMGGILMLLAELGFLNIFLGGGYKVEIGEVGAMVPVVYFFSDIPEWGAMLANIRNWWRSYPWLAWYPGALFFLSILAFNLWGEGLRRFLEETKLNLGRLVNRYTIIAALSVVLATGWLLRSSAPIEVYRPVAKQFNTLRAMVDLDMLASPAMQGRESGLGYDRVAADYIAQQMKDIGLFPAGDNDTFIQTVPYARLHIVQTPELQLLDPGSGKYQPQVYRKDFVEFISQLPTPGACEGSVVGVLAGPVPSENFNKITLNDQSLDGKILIVREQDLQKLNINRGCGVLVIPDESIPYGPHDFNKKFMYQANVSARLYKPTPMMYVTTELANRLLQTTGNATYQEFNRLADSLPMGQVTKTNPGMQVKMSIDAISPGLDEPHYNVIGYIPGEGAAMGSAKGGLDNQVILISAYYDGLGTTPAGKVYQGANDNASGVATMLEVARTIKNSPYFAKKTVVFVAWSGGEWRESLSVKNVMNAKTGFGTLNVEAVIELSGIAGGSGKGLSLGQGSSYRLVTLFQDAARRFGVGTTTRGRGPHFSYEARAGFGGRDAISAFISWDGSDQLAHTLDDNTNHIDAVKLRKTGQVVTLVVSVLSREVEY